MKSEALFYMAIRQMAGNRRQKTEKIAPAFRLPSFRPPRRTKLARLKKTTQKPFQQREKR
jgi:hypothetical protein